MSSASTIVVIITCPDRKVCDIAENLLHEYFPNKDEHDKLYYTDRALYSFLDSFPTTYHDDGGQGNVVTWGTVENYIDYEEFTSKVAPLITEDNELMTIFFSHESTNEMKMFQVYIPRGREERVISQILYGLNIQKVV